MPRVVAIALAGLMVAGTGSGRAQESADALVARLLPKHVDSASRGLKGVKPLGSAAATAEPAEQGDPTVSLTVRFATGSAVLTARAMGQLEALGKALGDARLAGYRFRIEGHTDTVGAAALNQTLSERRARSVVAFLTERFGIAGARLEPVGLGEGGLAVPTGPQVAEPRNRRVQVVNIGA